VAVLALVYGRTLVTGPLFLDRATKQTLFVCLIAFIVLAVIAGITGKWPLSPIQTTFLLGAVLALVGLMAWDFFRWRKRKKVATETNSANPSPAAPERPGWTILLWLVSGLTLTFAASLSGNMAAADILNRCASYDVVTFNPPPPGVDENLTYMLILHHGGHYYVRTVKAAPDNSTLVLGNTTLVINDGPGVTAELTKVQGVAKC